MPVKVLALLLLVHAFDHILSHKRTRPNILVVMSDAFVSLTFILSLPRQYLKQNKQTSKKPKKKKTTEYSYSKKLTVVFTLDKVSHLFLHI